MQLHRYQVDWSYSIQGLQRETASCILISTSETLPAPALRTFQETVKIDWLNENAGPIDRSNADCKTPITNPTVARAVCFVEALGRFALNVSQIFSRKVLRLQVVSDSQLELSAQGIFAGLHLTKSVAECQQLHLFSLKERVQCALKLPSESSLFPPKIAVDFILFQHLADICCLFFDGLTSIERRLRDNILVAVGIHVDSNAISNLVNFRSSSIGYTRMCQSVRSGPTRHPEGYFSLQQRDEVIVVYSRQLADCHRFNVEMSADLRPLVKGPLIVDAWHGVHFSKTAFPHLSANFCSTPFSGYIVLIGRPTTDSSISFDHGFICENGESLQIALELEVLPSASQFAKSVESISPNQDSFATQFRSHQMSETLFSITTIPIRCLLEQALTLPDSALDKEPRLTKRLLQLVSEFDVPLDILAAGSVVDVVKNCDDIELLIENRVFSAIIEGGDGELKRFFEKGLLQSFCRRAFENFDKLMEVARGSAKTGNIMAFLKEKELELVGEEQFYEAVRRNNLIRATAFLPAFVNQPNEAGDTPLILACRCGSLEMIRFLVEAHQGNVNQANTITTMTPVKELILKNDRASLLWIISLGAEVPNLDLETIDDDCILQAIELSKEYHCALRDDKVREMRTLKEGIYRERRDEWQDDGSGGGAFSCSLATEKETYYERHAMIQNSLPRGVPLGKMPAMGGKKSNLEKSAAAAEKEDDGTFVVRLQESKATTGLESRIMQIPSLMNEAVKSMPAVRPCICRVDPKHDWMTAAGVSFKQKDARAKCFDLVDSLTKGGIVEMHGTTHLLVAQISCFGKTALDAMAIDNVDVLGRLDEVTATIKQTINKL